MDTFPILSLLMFLPLIGALCILFLTKENSAVRMLALATALGEAILSFILYGYFEPGVSDFQFVEKWEWVRGQDIFYHVGVDGISILFILLTTFLIPICILASWKSITHRVKAYMVSFLLLESMIIGVFCALDLLLFYVFFEAVLIPMFLIIGIWGGENRTYASFKFFLYTLAGSVLSLIAIVYMYHTIGTMDIPTLMEQAPALPLEIQRWLWVAFLLSFAVKVPMWPVHTWLPDAHVQAPTAGSVILAGILLKLGGYGFLRLSLPLLPDASQHFAPLMFGLSVVAIIYTSLVALIQEDMKKMIAYSSVAHMGFVTLGIFSFNEQGLEGAMVVMISHGLVSAALFLCVGVLYDRLHTKLISRFGGVTAVMPVFAGLFMLFTMASVGLPGTSGFVGELLAMMGVYQASKPVAALAATGVILGAVYMLWLYGRVMFGTITNPEVQAMRDLTIYEYMVFVPIAILVLVVGIYPAFILDTLHASIDHLLAQIGR